MSTEQVIATLAEQIAETAANESLETLVGLMQGLCAAHPASTMISALVVACNGLGSVIQVLQPNHQVHMEIHPKGDQPPPGMRRAAQRKTH